MDRMSDSGSDDLGSNPGRVTFNISNDIETVQLTDVERFFILTSFK